MLIPTPPMGWNTWNTFGANISEALEDLEQQGRTLRLRGGLWIRPESLKTITGRFSALREGAGFVTPMRLADADDLGDSRWQFAGDKDIYIPAAQNGGYGARGPCPRRTTRAFG